MRTRASAATAHVVPVPAPVEATRPSSATVRKETNNGSVKKRVTAASKLQQQQPSSSQPPSAAPKPRANSASSVRSRSVVMFRLMEERGLLQPAELSLLQQFSKQSSKDAANLTAMFDDLWTRYLEPTCPSPPPAVAVAPANAAAAAAGEITSEQLQRYIDQDEQVNEFIECKTRLPNNIKRQVVLFALQALHDPEQPHVLSPKEVDTFVQQQVTRFRTANLNKEKNDVQRLLQQDQTRVDKLSQAQTDVVDRIHQLTVRIQQINTDRQTLLQTMSSKPVPTLDDATEKWLHDLLDWSHQNTNASTGNGLKSDTIELLTLIHTNLVQELTTTSATAANMANSATVVSEATLQRQRAEQYKQDIERILFPSA